MSMLTVVNLPAVVLRRIVRPTARDPFRAGHLVVAAVAAAAGLTVVVVVSPHRLGPALGVLALVAGALVGAVATRVPRRLGEERRVEERFFGTLGRPRATGPFRVLQRAIADVPTWAVIATGCVLALGSRRTG
ncbi:hypothetical protein, partial [Nostocoides japonicum]|uniref:hypothetical protein n=1 Tax=Nostocoides japonicum TaxID=99481 RepID=UPI00138F527B